MVDTEQAEAAFVKIIDKAPSSVIRKAAKKFWSAHKSDTGASDADGDQFVLAIQSISIDYRRPALECLDAFNTCKEGGDNISDCYLNLAIQFAQRVVHG